MRRLGPALLGVLWACSSPPTAGAILAKVDFTADATAVCVEVVVRTPSGTEARSKPVKTDRKQPLKVAVAKTGLPDTVTIYAVGYSDADCMTPSVPPERSDDVSGTFKSGKVTTVALTLAPHAMGVDLDGDGYLSVATGGDDCDDADPSVHPGALESCADGKDNNCDMAVDCAQITCGDQVCAAGGSARCKAKACAEISCTDGLDNDLDGLRDCADPDCAGASCPNGGVCMGGACKGANTETGLCADGADNDNDGKIDCDDPDCVGSSCNSGNACLSGTTCDATKSCGGGTVVVCATTDPCLKPNGICSPADAGCSFVPETSKSCDDHNGCTMNDVCGDAGVCAGAPIGCTPPAACLRSAGCSPDAGCLFIPAVGDACDDLNGCTQSDQCGVDAGCTGVPLVCAPSACQALTNQCTGDGGCGFTSLASGTACDAGVCNGSGGCIPTFPYPPSNFVESDLPTPAASTAINCTVAVNSHLTDGGVDFGGWCGAVAPPYRVISQVGGRDAVLVAFSNFDVGPDASVRLAGDRPVIFAATGNFTVEGEIVAGAGYADCLDGGMGGAANGNNGGSGGAFGSSGGSGGNAGPGGGVVNGEPLLVPLRGGCAGGNGARGGGGVQLTAAGNLSISGTIAAAGRAGQGGGPAYNGGQGAGSGGGVLLEGYFVLTGPISALTANGGSGGEGAGLFLEGADGVAGSSRSATPAPGGDSLNTGAKGGDGAAGTTGATAGSDVAISGGGGGGAGVGRIRINSLTGCSLGGGVVSPPATTNRPDAGC
jgi:hypothetical protein